MDWQSSRKIGIFCHIFENMDIFLTIFSKNISFLMNFENMDRFFHDVVPIYAYNITQAHKKKGKNNNTLLL